MPSKPNQVKPPPTGANPDTVAAVKARQAQLAGQVLAPADPRHIVINGRDLGVLPNTGGPPQDPYNRRGGAPEVPAGWAEQAEQLEQLPNWDKLSATERIIVGAMPGQTGGLAEAYASWDSDLAGLPSQVLSPFKWAAGGALSLLTQPIVAGALSALDVGAEFTERSSGLLRQWVDTWGDSAKEAEFRNNLQAAWYAGTLTADSADLEIAIGPDGISTPSDLGGVAVLVKSRQRIAGLVADGATWHDATIMARDEYLASLGALAIRAQIQDLAWHIVVDPLNIVLGAIKPFERVAALRKLTLGLTSTPEEVARLAGDVNKARLAVEAAQGTGDLAKVADAEKGLTAAEAAVTAAQRSAMSPFEQKVTAIFGLGDEERGARNIIKLTGGDPGLTAPRSFQIGEAVGKRDWGALWRQVNPLALSPMARAQEYVNIFQDFFGTHLLSGNRLADGSYNVDAIVRGMQRFIGGVADPALGNLVLSIEGRSLRTAALGFGPKLDALLSARQATGRLETPLLMQLSEVLGVTPHSIIKRLNAGEIPAVLAQIQEKLAANPAAAEAILKLLGDNNLAALTPDVLARLSHVLGGKEFAGYTDDLFLAEVQGKLFDHVEQQAIQQFGLKTRGLIRQASDALKSVESLIYLRVNPGYPIKNFINNNITLIARGAFGTNLDVSAKAFIKRNGFLPPRFAEGFGVEGDVGVKAAGGQAYIPGQTLREAEQGTGRLQRLSERIRGIKIPEVVDFSRWAGKGEGQASARAMTVGYERHFPQIYKRLITNALDTVRADFQGVARGTLDDIRNTLASARFESDLDALKLSDNLRLSTEGVLSRAEKATGLKLDQILDWSEVRPLLDDVVATAKSQGWKAAEAKFAEFTEGVQTHIDDLLERALENARDEAAAKVAAEGPAAFVKVWSDGLDEMWQGHERHVLNMEEALSEIRRGNKDKAFELWDETNAKSRAYWQRQWDRFDNRIAGFAEKAKELKLPGLDEIQTQAREWRSGWEDFFTKRDGWWKEYWDARRLGETPPRPAEEIKALIGEQYRKMVDTELRHQRAIDARTANMLPSEQQPLYLAWRNRLNVYRTADKEAVIAFRQKIEGLRPDQLEAAWKAHNADRIKAWNQIRKEEQIGAAALQGDPRARGRYTDSAQRIAAKLPVLRRNRDTLYRLASENGIMTATKAGNPTDRHLISALNKYLPAGADKFTREELTIGLTPERLAQAQASLEARAGKVVGQIILPKMADNYRKPLDFYTPTVYREVSLRDADPYLPNSNTTVDMSGDVFLASTADMALGQGKNKGVLLEFDANGIQGQVGTGKPAWEAAYENGQAEFIARHNKQGDYQGALRAITIKPDAEASGGTSKRLQTVLAGLEEKGWTKTILADGSVRYAAPSATPADAAKAVTVPDLPTIPDVESIIKPELFMGTGLDQHWYMRGGDGLRAVKNALRDTLDEPPTKWGDLNDAQQGAARELIEQAKGALKDARYHATRMAEFTRDSALLNYNRRFNYNTWLGTIVPFEFWATQSAWKWAMHSLDRPAMLSAYLRIKKFLETAYRPERGLPSRLKGSIRIAMPFMPEWMGNEVFFDPLRISLPFDNWASPFEQMAQQDAADAGQANRKLEELYNDGQIEQAEFQAALESHEGPVWERALMLARQDDTEGRLDGWDVVTGLMPPHLPILYGLDAARNRNPFEERGPILPLTRSWGNVLATLSVDPAGGLNPEAALRKGLGLHPFNKWDDYLAERMLSNMVGMGELDVNTARRAMIEHTGEAWDTAVQRAGVERAGGNLATAALGIAGIPAKGYPPGEEAQRKLQAGYTAAWKAYDASGGNYDGTVGAWLKQNPGYEARLALFDKPEERLHQFLTDEFWDTWNNLPDLTKNEIKAQFGRNFTDTMLNPDTGYGKNADPDQLAAWLKLMGGNPPGSLQSAVDTTTLETTRPEIAQRAQVFYDTRDAQYRGWREQQNGYFDISDELQREYDVEVALVELDRAGDDKKARSQVFRQYPALGEYFDARKAATSAYLDSHPLLRAYWKWRDSFLARNTEVAPYLDDDPVYAERAPQGDYLPEPDYTWDEWRQAVGPDVSNLIVDYVDYGMDLPDVARDRLEAEMDKIGWQGDVESFARHIASSRQLAEMYAQP